MGETTEQKQIILTETEVAYIIDILTNFWKYPYYEDPQLQKIVKLLLSHFPLEKDNPA